MHRQVGVVPGGASARSGGRDRTRRCGTRLSSGYRIVSTCRAEGQLTVAQIAYAVTEVELEPEAFVAVHVVEDEG